MTTTSLPSLSLPPAEAKTVESAIQEWAASDRIKRIWAHDASVWSNTDEAKWLGWLSIVTEQIAAQDRFAKFSEEVMTGGFSHIVLLGMGGSSLCPEVLRLSFGHLPSMPDLHVLDSTDPAQVLAIEGKINLATTLFIVSSKSGSTLEPNVFKDYFFERTGRNGKQFIAVTDPGSHMQQVAEASGFRHIFFGAASIGGRFSALSDFGLIPAAAIGMDVSKLLATANAMVKACQLSSAENPGLQLGVTLGTLSKSGRNKVTLIASPGIHDLGAWLEQLIAESTGKEGKALIPVDREPLGAPDFYGNDRVFAYLRLQGAADPAQDRAVEALASAGHPVIRISLNDVYDLGQEFFRWEFATAIAGSILGINPFNQPDVEASKIATKKLTSEYEATGLLPQETAAFTEDGIKIYGKTSATNLVECLRAHLGSLQPGDYFAQLAYVEMTPEHEAKLTAIRRCVAAAKQVATCVGFGPRFLHSTGQAYKGGPNTGVFLQITCDDAKDVAIPGSKYTFSVVKAAQAQGDLQVLVERGRRVLRLHLGADVKSGLAKLANAVERALQ